MSEIRHSPGHFCWAELATSDPEAARGFYSGMLGWTARVDEMKGGGTYTTFFYEGLETAACYRLSPSMESAGIPPHWLPYIMVESAAATTEAVAAAGGQVEFGPRQAGEYGQFAVIRDPGGAYFAIWEPGSHFGSRNGHVLGRHCWTELATRETQACQEFYCRVFGWDVHTGDMGGMAYISFLLNGAPIGGMFAMPPMMDGVPANWGVYFSVADVAAAVAATQAAGGAVLNGPMEIAGVGIAAAMRDAQGAHVSVIQLNSR
jgi:predicted enzyme related to lactoylglutathione lyase